MIRRHRHLLATVVDVPALPMWRVVLSLFENLDFAGTFSPRWLSTGGGSISGLASALRGATPTTDPAFTTHTELVAVVTGPRRSLKHALREAQRDGLRVVPVEFHRLGTRRPTQWAVDW